VFNERSACPFQIRAVRRMCRYRRSAQSGFSRRVAGERNSPFAAAG